MYGFFQVKYLGLILANLGIMLRSLGEPFAGRVHGAKGDLRTWAVLLCGRIVKFDGFEDIFLYAEAFLLKKA
tara:strand:- start:534 stop:749 length:216 start_codon:yes stop_codon:yes gene_type:complete